MHVCKTHVTQGVAGPVRGAGGERDVAALIASAKVAPEVIASTTAVSTRRWNPTTEWANWRSLTYSARTAELMALPERAWRYTRAMTKPQDDVARAELAATQDGRVTIPVQVRRAAGIEPGHTLVVYVEHGRVVLEERSHLLARIQEEVRAADEAAGHTGSAVDELIAERRAEAAREAAEIEDRV